MDRWVPKADDVTWETCFWMLWVDNKQEHTLIFTWNVACTEMEGQALHPHLYSLADQNCLQTSYPTNCSYSGLDQPLYVVQRTLTYTTLNFLRLSATEVNIFNFCCMKIHLTYLNYRNNILLLENSLKMGSILK